MSGGARVPRAAKRARFASWNLRWFPDGSPGNAEPGTDVAWLACVLAWLDADVLALQEVKQTPKAERALATLRGELDRLSGRRYRVELDDCGSRVPQHVGLMFDESRVRGTELSTLGALNPSGTACGRQLRPGLSSRFVFPGGLDLYVVSAHFKSHADERSLALREASFAAVPELLRSAERVSRDGDWLLLGDLNTMGCETCQPQLSAAEELSAARRLLQQHGLRVLPLNAPGTELHRGRYSLLDHAVASASMRELPLDTLVQVEGACRDAAKPPSKLPLSDHCPLLLDLTDADLD